MPILATVLIPASVAEGDIEMPSPGYVWLYDENGDAVYDNTNRRVQVPVAYANS